MDSFATQNIRHQRNIITLMLLIPLVVLVSVGGMFYLTSNIQTQAQATTGPSVVYDSDGKTVLVNGVSRSLGADIRYDSGSTPGTITKISNGGITYTSYVNAERTEQVYATQSSPAWPDNSSGWFAFDFTAHDSDASWRVIEQEHEGDMSPSRSLEAFQGGSTSQVKICSRYGTPNTAGCAKSWTFNSSVGTRIQIVGYEKFGQGNAEMQAWWRPFGTNTWTQFANSSGFSMGYTSGHPGRYHKRGTYHGNHAEQSSITWYATALMMPSRSSAEALLTDGSSPTPPTPPPPSPSPTPPPPPPTQPPPPPPPQPSTTQSPYTSAISLPGKLEVENYDRGGEGVAYHDIDTSNQGGQYRTDSVDLENSQEGGYSVGWVAAGEWLEYTTNIAQSGKYDITFRVATDAAGDGTWALKQGSTTLATATSGNTGGWYAWKNVTIKDVNLTAGSNQVFRLTAGGEPLNINYVSFAKQSSGGTPTPVPQPSPSPSPSPLPPSPPPVIEIPGAGSSDPVDIPDELPTEEDGSLIADFNGDGSNDVAKDLNNDGSIDPNSEIVIDGSTNPSLTDTTRSPISVDELATLNANNELSNANSDTVTFKAGPLPEVKLAKPVAYTFLIAQGVAITGIGTYLAFTKLAIFAGIRRKWGL